MLTTIMAFAASIVAVVVGLALYRKVLAAPATNPTANEIASAISEGATAFLSRQYRTIAMVGFPMIFILGFALGWWYSFGFVMGAVAVGVAVNQPGPRFALELGWLGLGALYWMIRRDRDPLGAR